MGAGQADSIDPVLYGAHKGAAWELGIRVEPSENGQKGRLALPSWWAGDRTAVSESADYLTTLLTT